MDCHRHRLIGAALNERGIEVQHIRKDGTVKMASFLTEPSLLQPALF